MVRHVVLAALLFSGAAFAQAPGKPDPAAVSAGSYVADPAHSLVVWTLDHLGFSPYSGIFGDVNGTLVIDPKNLAGAKVDVTIPVAKVTTASSALTQHLLRPGKDGGKPDFFGPAPADARFVSTKVVPKGNAATVTGDFTLNGVTRPLTLDVSFYGAGKAPPAMGGKENVGFRATGTLKRSDFGLGFFAPVLGDEVKLDITAAFQR